MPTPWTYIDLLAAGITACVLGSVRAIGAVVRPRAPAARRRLMVINSFYRLDVIRARRAEHVISARDASGYFEHVWSVHPFVGAEQSATPSGPLVETRLAERHTVVEANPGRFAALHRLPVLNFVLAQFALLRHLDEIVRRERVAVVQGDPYYHGLVALCLARMNRRALEIRVSGNQDAIYNAVGRLAYPRILPSRRLEQAVARRVLSRADVVVVQSNDNREFAVANRAPVDRTVNLGCWGMIDPVHLQPPADRPPLRELCAPYAICVCRLERVKHPEDFVRAMAVARRTHPELRGVIAGDGSMRQELIELARQLGVNEAVMLAGDRDHEWLARALCHAAVVVVPLAGLSLVEAALSGTAIVAYDVEWHSELITSGVTGVLVGYRDVAALGNAVSELLDDPARAASMGAGALEQILETMNPEKLRTREHRYAEGLVELALGRG